MTQHESTEVQQHEAPTETKMVLPFYVHKSEAGIGYYWTLL